MFKTKISRFLDLHYEAEKLVLQIDFGYLQRLVEGCFSQKATGLNQEQKATTILACLFSRFIKGFRFRKIIEQIPNTKERHRFLSEILFQIFTRTFPFKHLKNKMQFELYLYQVLALCASDSTIKAFWRKLSRTEKIKCLGFCYAFFNEGSFRILRNSDQRALCEPIEKGLVHKSALWSWAENRQNITQRESGAFQKAMDDSVEKEIDALLVLLASLQKRVSNKLCKFPLQRDSVKRFVEVFGLYEHQAPLSLEYDSSLSEKLIRISNSFTEDGACFVERILLHIYALSHAREWYEDGLKHIVHALPTVDKELSKLSWLESTAKSLQNFAVENHPIFVFDQSEKKLFLKNAAYIQKLSKRTNVPIVHLDKETIIQLAKKLHVEKLILTDSKGNFGYGGARNAVFLLAPHLSGQSNPFIHMGDDDLYVPASQVYSDALFAHLHKHEYICRYGYGRGRFPADVNFDLLNVLEKPHTILSQCHWVDTPFNHGMCGTLTKPKICLNLPFGQEEQHMLCTPNTFFDFRKPTIHLAGARFPTSSKIPENRYSGVARYLRKAMPDLFQRLLVTELLDPCNRYDSCALPWNSQKPFQSFQEVLEYMRDPKTIQAMQKQFWKNLARINDGFAKKIEESDTVILSSQSLSRLLNNEHKRYFKKQKELLRFYEDLRQEAHYFKEFSLKVSTDGTDAAKKWVEETSGKRIEEMHLCYTLYLFCKAVGEAGFTAILAEKVRNPRMG